MNERGLPLKGTADDSFQDDSTESRTFRIQPGCHPSLAEIHQKLSSSHKRLILDCETSVGDTCWTDSVNILLYTERQTETCASRRQFSCKQLCVNSTNLFPALYRLLSSPVGNIHHLEVEFSRKSECVLDAKEITQLLAVQPKWTSIRTAKLNREQFRSIALAGRPFVLSICEITMSDALLEAMQTQSVSLELDAVHLGDARSASLAHLVQMTPYPHTLSFAGMLFNDLDWQLLANASVEKLSLQGGVSPMFLATLLQQQTPCQGPKQVDMATFKVDGCPFDKNLLSLLQTNRIVGLKVCFQRGLNRNVMAWQDEGWLAFRQALETNTSLQSLCLEIDARADLKNERDYSVDCCICYMLGTIANHPSLCSLGINTRTIISRSLALALKNIAKRNPRLVQVYNESSFHPQAQDWCTIVRSTLIENKFWPLFQQPLAPGMYAQGMVKSRVYPSLFYQCLRHRGFQLVNTRDPCEVNNEKN